MCLHTKKHIHMQKNASAQKNIRLKYASAKIKQTRTNIDKHAQTPE